MSFLQSIPSWPARHPARAGALGGWFQQGCGMLVALLLIPVVTRFLTPNEAGIWFAFQGLVTIIGMLDLGFGFAISRQAAFTLGATESTVAKDDFIHLAHGWTGVAQLFLLTRTLYRWLAVAAGVAAFEIFSRFGNLVPPETPGVRWCWYAMAGASVILILVGGQSAFLNGLGAVYQTRFLAGLYQIIAGAGAAWAAWQGFGLAAMGASFAVTAVIYRAAVVAVRHWMTAPMRGAPVLSPPSGSLRRLAKAAIPIGGVNIFGSLVYTIQAPMLGALLGPEKVAPFYLAQKIAMACNMLALHTLLPQLPFFTQALGAGNLPLAFENMKKTILRTSLLVLVSALAFYFLSPLAASALLHHEVYIDRLTLMLMSFDLLLLGLAVICGHYVLASGRNPFVVPTLMNGLSSVGITCFLVPFFGLPGLPTATLVAGLLFNYRVHIIKGFSVFNRLSKTT